VRIIVVLCYLQYAEYPDMKRTGNIFTFIVLIAVVAGAARYFYSGFQLKQYGNTTTGIIDHVNTGEHKRRGVVVSF
jgi:hypothetical protein